MIAPAGRLSLLEKADEAIGRRAVVALVVLGIAD